MNELALFAGAGGGILGSQLLGWRVVCAVEKDPYCREVLLRRQEEGHLEPFPIWDDARLFNGHDWRPLVDIVTAGFPCQPFSVAGQQKAQMDDRNLWPDTFRVITEVHEEWGNRFERHWAPLIEEYRLEDADYAIVTIGSMSGAGKDAVDAARELGKKVGLIKIKTFRPL